MILFPRVISQLSFFWRGEVIVKIFLKTDGEVSEEEESDFSDSLSGSDSMEESLADPVDPLMTWDWYDLMFGDDVIILE